MASVIEVQSAMGAMTIVPDDDFIFLRRVSHLYVGGTGNLKIDTGDKNTVTLVGVIAGTLLPVVVTKVGATGTTATNLVGLMP